MKTPRLASLLLLTTAFAMPSVAWAQDGQADTSSDDQSADEQPDISLPGAEIIVTGRRDRNVQRAAPQVVSVLGAEDIARTGEGNIAGALSRVTGLSLVGKGFVYVRGLGDRYSLAMLNGSPLPSPEPLKRVVPLDLFPSSVIASSLVQKSYSANFPGEFGGGVINLTTKSAPRDAFLTISASTSWDSETTGQIGYSYYGSATDYIGWDNGQRAAPPALQAYFDGGVPISSGQVNTIEIGKQLVTTRNGVLQHYSHMPWNWKGDVSAGKSFDIGGTTLGVIATGGYSNTWNTRGAIQQTSLSSDLSGLESDFYRVTTDQRIVVNGLAGIGLEFGSNKIRWTNLFIHDTLKDSRLGVGSRHATDFTFEQQNTAWYERQLFDTQLVGEFKITPDLSVDLRGAYANSKRKAPGELYFEYVKTHSGLYGEYFINQLNNGQTGDARISYSDLNEDLWAGSADVTYRLMPSVSATVGYSYADTRRTSSRRDFSFTAPNTMPIGIGLFRPDLLLQPTTIEYFNIQLIDTNEGAPAFLATLRNQAGYIKVDAQITDAISVDVGVRYESAKMVVSPIQIFSTVTTTLGGTSLDHNYWLPTATVTWNLQTDMQVRLNASKTIARPQFRELLFQPFFDPDSNRQYRGNPLLDDSKLTNAEVRWEWYFDRDQRLSAAGFYKKIDKPIEAFITGVDFLTSYANAPSADLWGAEFELQKYFDLAGLGQGFWSGRRAVVIANYTYSDSKINVATSDTVLVFPVGVGLATDYFQDGSPLTGQSQHLVNFQVGLEDQDSLSQQTILVTYASKRVTSRGLNNTGQPDVIEYPGLRVDFVARQGIDLFGVSTEWKFEARNIFGSRHLEYQTNGTNRVDYNTYDQGTVVSLGASVKF